MTMNQNGQNGSNSGNGSARNIPMICVADVDTRLDCSSVCVTCSFYMRDRRQGERRDTPRRTRDRRVLARDY
jgi:hypothetical protein